MSKTLRVITSASLVALVFVSTAHAATDDEYLAAYRLVQRAQAGDKGAIPDAIAAFDALHKAEPTNPILLVNLGAANTMRSRTTILPWDKMGYTEEGLAQEDKALALLNATHDTQLQNGTPITLATKFIAANTWLAVPSFFNRGARGEKLLNEVMSSPLLPQSSLQFRGAVWLRAARLAQAQKRPDDARRLVGQVVQAAAPQVDQARTLLAEIDAPAPN